MENPEGKPFSVLLPYQANRTSPGYLAHSTTLRERKHTLPPTANGRQLVGGKVCFHSLRVVYLEWNPALFRCSAPCTSRRNKPLPEQTFICLGTSHVYKAKAKGPVVLSIQISLLDCRWTIKYDLITYLLTGIDTPSGISGLLGLSGLVGKQAKSIRQSTAPLPLCVSLNVVLIIVGYHSPSESMTISAIGLIYIT